MPHFLHLSLTSFAAANGCGNSGRQLCLLNPCLVCLFLRASRFVVDCLHFICLNCLLGQSHFPVYFPFVWLIANHKSLRWPFLTISYLLLSFHLLTDRCEWNLLIDFFPFPFLFFFFGLTLTRWHFVLWFALFRYFAAIWRRINILCASTRLGSTQYGGCRAAILPFAIFHFRLSLPLFVFLLLQNSIIYACHVIFG